MHLNQLLDLPNITSHSIKGLLINLYTEHSQALKALDCDVNSATNPLLSALLLRKMDQDLRKKLENFRSQSGDEADIHTLPEVSDIIKFLNTECSQTEDANIHSLSQAQKPVQSSTHDKVLPKKTHFRSDVAMVTAQSSNAQPPSQKNKPTYVEYSNF